MKTKEDIEYHSDGFRFRPSNPAVNVKVYKSLEQGYKEWKRDYHDAVDARFTVEWIEKHVSEEALDQTFWLMCELRWEDITEEARYIWGKHVKVYSEGRSGGWAVVHGINTDVDSWDAIAFTDWKRFAKYARAVADGIMYDVVDSICINRFDLWRDEQSELFAPEIPEGFPV